MYQPHPNQKLSALFSQKPFQGADPHQAAFLFIGLDANYDHEIERSPIFEEVLNYHHDGAEFWRQRGVHHPFLLPQYSGDGRRYHRNFARIGFEQEHASLVSFVELLHVPTVGRSSLNVKDLDPGHLRYLNSLMLSGRAQHVFLSAGVWRLMQASKAFPWLHSVSGAAGALRILHSDALRTVYLHLHFSNYGKFQKQMNLEAEVIRSLLDLHMAGIEAHAVAARCSGRTGSVQL